MRDYFHTIGEKQFCATFKVYPSGFPVTSLTHAVDDANDAVTLCGLAVGSGSEQWYYDEWGRGIECKKCRQAILKMEVIND